jgi:uncharacterized repeat protein (TIGR01451 family)
LAVAKRWSFTMAPLDHRSIRLVEDWYRGVLTPGGRALLWGAVATGIMLLGGLVVPLLVPFGFCVGFLVAGALLGLPFRPRVVGRRRLAAFPSAGEVLRYDVTLHNQGTRPARNLAVEERGLPPDLRPVGEAPVVPVLMPGESATVPVSLLCRTRGAYQLGALQVSSAFPSGLFKWPRTSTHQDRLLVYPRFTPLESFDVPTGRNYQPGGITIASQVGDSTEFFGTRDWREGDRLRDIHWPSLARTGKLIVKEFQEEYFIRLAMVLDVEVKHARHEPLLEKSLSLAAGIADTLAKRDYIVDIFAAGPRIFHFQAGRALAHFENILEILACLEAGDVLDMEALEAALVPEAPRLSAVIMLCMDWEPRRAAFCDLLKQHGVALRVLSMRPDRRPVGLSPEEVVEAA